MFYPPAVLPSAGQAAAVGKVRVERIARGDANGPGQNAEEARAIVERDAPELLALLDELKDSLGELRSRLGPVLQQVQLVAERNSRLGLQLNLEKM